MSADTRSDLFLPYQLGSLTLANRIVMAPLTRSRAGAGLERNAPLNAPDQATVYGGDARGYTDYPVLAGAA